MALSPSLRASLEAAWCDFASADLTEGDAHAAALTLGQGAAAVATLDLTVGA